MLVPVLIPSSGIPMGRALAVLKPKDRATLHVNDIVRWEDFSSHL